MMCVHRLYKYTLAAQTEMLFQSHLPAGMEQIGYDSDTQRYTFRDSDGSIYEGGQYGGDLVLVSRPTKPNATGGKIPLVSLK